MAVIPITPIRVGRTGWYKSERKTPADGACGVHPHPCLHPGVDLGGAKGTKVRAPEAGTIVKATAGTAPFGGYGPWVVMLLGKSGIYHLLAHLDTATANLGTQGMQVVEGQVIGTTSSANHTHWETRRKMVPNFAAGETNYDNNIDPTVWYRDQQAFSEKAVGPILLLTAGAFLLWQLQKKLGA